MNVAASAAAQRPRLGLVLGGGGVRGLAHAGVMATLDRAGLHADVVVGVSMGALVSIAYAARSDWQDALQAVDRSRLPTIAGTEEDFALAKLRGALRNARRLVPSVWTLGRHGYEDYGGEVLKTILDGRTDFGDLRLPAAVTATDLDLGERVIMTEGDVTSAVLASGAIPGLTRPIEREGRTLIDGAFADPSPIDVARDLGADVVVAVHVGQHLLGTEADNWATALLRGFETSQKHFALERMRHADLMLRPDFPDRVSMLNFSAIDDVVRCGRRCARSHLADIARLLDERASEPTSSDT